jgi:hypothetical protein
VDVGQLAGLEELEIQGRDYLIVSYLDTLKLEMLYLSGLLEL